MSDYNSQNIKNMQNYNYMRNINNMMTKLTPSVNINK